MTGSYDQPRQHIKKQRYYFANKGPSSQSYGFSSSHAWMWELDYKESWALKNWYFWTVVLEKTLEESLGLQGSQAFCLSVQFSSVSQSCPTLRPYEPQHVRPPCPSPTPGVHPNPCPLCQWCHPTVSSSVIPFSSCPQSLPASGSFPMNQLFASGGQSTGVSASKSVLPMNTQDWSPLGWTGWISLQSKGFSRVFYNTRI